MSEEKPSLFNSPRLWLTVIILIIIISVVLSVVMTAPSISPIASIRDTDADGVPDARDFFPNDPNEWDDTDSDGVGNNADVFPTDPTETNDTDSDGVGDNADAFPNDPTETKDTDSDGVGDNADAFPNDPTETKDTDSDGVGDNADAFPNDPTESQDSDSDGVGDNGDFWDTGNGGLIVRIELFVTTIGECATIICDPSFRLEVDWDRDGVADVARRADFTGVWDTNPLVNPVSWTFDIPDGVESVILRMVVLDLFFTGLEVIIDIHPDGRYSAHSTVLDSPFVSFQFVTEGFDAESGRLTYSVEAVGV